MSPVPFVYRAAWRAAAVAAPLLAGGTSKLARGLAGRRHAHGTLADWGETARDPTRPVVWLHAPSVGEALQAGAVVGALRVERPGLQIVFTHFSPSAEGMGLRIGADASAYLPWDASAPVRRALEGVRPDLLIFTKTEIWPVLVEESARRRIPVAIVAATVPPGAGRGRWPARSVLRPAWSALSLACACAEEDAARLLALGVREAVLRVTGDPAVDAAAARATAADPGSPTLAPLRTDRRPTVVAGSTWPEDEAALLPALVGVRNAVPDARVILAPHEPSAARVRDGMARLADAGWRARTLADVEASGSAEGADAIVVERVGVLAHLYTVGDVAYVGGGFGRRGLHSVLEPAAAGLPVVFGPRHERAPAAGALLAAGGARVARDRADLEDILTAWLTDAKARGGAGQRAFGYIGTHIGAAQRTGALLDPLFTSRRPG
jgi:3-deoxy-D-manno-octulosonic-acid transferase